MTTKPIVSRSVGNLAAHSPLMRKGGVHQKSKSSLRRQQQKKVRKAIDHWYKKS